MPLLCYDSNRTNYNQEGKYKVCINYTKKKKNPLCPVCVSRDGRVYKAYISPSLFCSRQSLPRSEGILSPRENTVSREAEWNISKYLYKKNGDGETAQWLSAQIALPEVLGSMPNTHIMT